MAEYNLNNRFDTVYINGDSYCATSDRGFESCFIDPKDSTEKVFSDYIQDTFPNLTVVNSAIAGSNNDRIFRSTIEEIYNLKKQNKRVLLIVGFSYCSRQEVVYKGNKKSLLDTISDHMHRDFLEVTHPLTTLDRVVHEDNNEYYQTLLDNQDRTQQVLEFCTKLLMFTGWCKSNDIEYFLFSGANNRDQARCKWDMIKSTQVYKNIIEDPNIHEFFSLSMPTFATNNNLETTTTGHMFADGHEKFAKYIVGKILND